MNIREFIEDTFSIASDAELAESFGYIAEALGINSSGIDTTNRELMINAIVESFDADDLNESNQDSYKQVFQSFFIEADDDEEEDDEVEDDEVEEMKHGKKHKKAMKEQDDEEEDDEDDEDEMEEGKYKKNMKEMGMRKKHSSMKKENAEDHFITSSDIDINEDINAMFKDDDTLTEEFREKAKTIFETAVVAKVNEKIAVIIEEFNDMLEEKVTEIESELEENVDSFLNYTVKEWMTENEIAIESGAKTEVVESFMEGLKNLLDEHYIDVPEQKIDIVEQLQEQIEELESGLNEALEENVVLSKRLNESTREIVIDELSESLSEMQREKFESLMEGVIFEDEKSFRTKAQVVLENYFPDESVPTNETLTEEVDDDIVIPDDEPSGDIAGYVRALSRLHSK
jgi:hypothetical protein